MIRALQQHRKRQRWTFHKCWQLWTSMWPISSCLSHQAVAPSASCHSKRVQLTAAIHETHCQRQRQRQHVQVKATGQETKKNKTQQLLDITQVMLSLLPLSFLLRGPLASSLVDNSSKGDEWCILWDQEIRVPGCYLLLYQQTFLT